MVSQNFQHPISKIKLASELNLKLYEEARKKVLDSAKEAVYSGNPDLAEQIIRNGLYDIEFRNYQGALEEYHSLKSLAEKDPIVKKVLDEKGTLLICLNCTQELQKELNNFDQRINPFILRMKKLVEGTK